MYPEENLEATQGGMSMSTKTAALKADKKKTGWFSNIRYDLKNNKALCLLCLPMIIWFLIFAYTPLVYLVVAFKKYSAVAGLWGSEWVGLKNFEAFFGSTNFLNVTYNTVVLNAMFIVATMFFSIIIAIAISEIHGKMYKKSVQSVVILPHFISWTVIALLCESLLKTNNGFMNNIIVSLGGKKINFFQNASVWPTLLTILRVWQGAGYGSIVYLATITGIDQSIYEAARIDGASRAQCIWYITLPVLRTTAVLLFIMSVGKIFNGDFGMIYNLVGSNTLLYKTTDVIDTYVYRMLVESTNIGQSTAVSLWQSLMGLLIVLGTNALARKVEPDSALF